MTNRSDTITSAEFPAQFKADERSHAVAKKRERLVEIPFHCLGKSRDHHPQPVIRRFLQTVFPARQVHRKYFGFVAKNSFPLIKPRRPSTGMRKTEQADSSILVTRGKKA